jgi:hypothetical protein
MGRAAGPGRAGAAFVVAWIVLGGKPAADTAASPSSFYTVTPCRVFDSRLQPPALASGVERVVDVAGLCGVPAEASAIAFSIAATAATAQGHVVLGAAGSSNLPVVNFPAGITRAGNGVARLSAAGEVSLVARLVVPGSVDVVLDVSGYFVENQPPGAVADEATVAEDTPATAIDVLANDDDPDGGAISVASVTQATNGSVAITGDGAGVSYAPAADYCNDPPGTTPDTFTYTLSPGSSSATVSVRVTCINDAPVLGGVGTVAFTEGAGPVAVAPGLVVADVDDAQLESAQVTITNLLDAGEETLAASTAGTAITALYAAPTLTLTGTDTLANYQAVLRSVTYGNASTDPDTTTRVVSVAVSDGEASSTAQAASVTLTAVNDAPVLATGAGSPEFVENGSPVAVAPALTVLDTDDASLASAQVTITNLLDAGQETLAASTAGTSITASYAAPTLTLSGTDTLASYQAVLRSVSYANASEDPSTTPRVLSFTVSDGGATSSPATKSVAVTAVNDAPVLAAGGGSPSFTEDGPAVAIDPALALSDPDDATLASATVTIENLLDAGQETLSATTAGTAISAVFVAPTLSLTGSDTLASYQAVLRSVAYANASQNPSSTPRTVRFQANDGTSPSNTVAKLVQVVPVNDAPVLGGAGSVTYTEGDGALVVAPALTLADADNANLTGATVTITNLADAGAEALAANTTGTSIVAVYAAPTLTLAGTDTVARYLQVLRSVAYQNTSQNPSPVARSLALAASDGAGTGATVATVNVVPVNDPPLLGAATVDYATAGNTQLHVAGDTLPGLASVSDAQGVLAKAGGSDPDGPAAPSIVAASGTSASGGQFVLDSDGSFTYVPAAGFSGTDTFAFAVTDGVDTVPGTVRVTVGTVVWYVRDVVDERNAAGGDGRSTDAFETLAAAETASLASHTIFVFAGETAQTPLAGGIALKNGQRLIGEAVGLTVAPHGTLVAAGGRPRVASATGDAVSVPATAGARTGIEIRGLEIAAPAGNAVDVTSAGGNAVAVTIADNVLQAGLEGIDLNASASAAFTAVVQGNTIASTVGNAFDARTASAGAALSVAFNANTVVASGPGAAGAVVDGSPGGAVVVTGLADNVVAGATGGDGIAVQLASFDALPGGAVEAVSGGTTRVGAAGDGVAGSALRLVNVAGAIAFTDLDLYADNGAALQLSGTGPFNGTAGTQLTVTDGAATLVAAGGPAVDATAATLVLAAAGVTSTGSPTSGIRLANVVGGTSAARFGAPAGSAISGAAGTAFDVSGGNATISFAGPISYPGGAGAGARAVSITGWSGADVLLSGAIADTGLPITISNNGGTGTIRFAGPLTLTPAAGQSGLVASSNSNSGGLSATASTSTIETTNAAALSVTGTRIGAGGLVFQRLSANGGANGIVLDTQDSAGGLSVSGSGAAGSGGVIRNMSGDGIRLVNARDVSLAWMTVEDNGGSGVHGENVTGFTLSDSVLDDNADTATGAEAGLRALNPQGAWAIRRTTVSDSYEDNVRITASGALASLAVEGSTIGAVSRVPAPLGGNGLALIGSGVATAGAVTVTGTTFTGNRGAGFVSSFIGTGSQALTLSGNTFTNNGRALSLATGGTAGLTLAVLNNQATGSTGSAVELVSSPDTAAAAVVRGTVANNTIGTSGAADSGSRDAYGIAIDLRGDERAILDVSGNTVRRSDWSGVFVSDADFGTSPDASDSDVTVRNNAVSEIDDNSGFPCGAPWGTHVDFRHTTQGCLELQGNSSAASPQSCPDSARFRVRQRDTSVVLFERLSDGDATPGELVSSTATVGAHVVAENAAGSTANVLLATGFTEAASGACVKP